MQNTPVTFKLDISIRDKASRMKKIHKYKTYDLLFTDMLDFFLENDLSPKDASKPLHKLISDVRDTFVTFHRTFETKKLMPILLELKQQYLSTNLTMQDFINYSTKYNTHLLDVVENVPQNKRKNTPVFKDKIDVNDDEVFKENQIKTVDSNLEELKVLFAEFEKSKSAKFSEGKNMYQYDVMSYNMYMDKIRLILNRK